MSFTVSLDPNDARIVFASETHVTLTSSWCEHDDADKYRVLASGKSVLMMCRQLYTNVMQEWLDEQAEYCGGEHFCGYGFIAFDEGVELLQDGATLPAHMIEPRPLGLAEADYLDFTFAADCATEFYVEVYDEEAEPLAA
jgi:hypothetical protein